MKRLLVLGALLAAMPIGSANAAGIPSQLSFGRSDLATLAMSAVAIAYTAHNDLWLTDEALEERTVGENRLATGAQFFGNGAVVAPALAAWYAGERLTGHPGEARATLRAVGAVGAAGVVALALKEVTGRARPYQSPNDPGSFRPFSGDASFPSGHATIAFAAAAAIDGETSARWIPWVVYPAAALVGWSRVHDQQHWTSDVVAGAAVGFWTARKTDDWLRARDEGKARFGFRLVPERRGVKVTLRF